MTKALLEQDLLPDVISGSSAGSFVAAVIGTHDEATLTRSAATVEAGDAFGDLGSGAGSSSGRTIAGRQQIGRGDLQAAIEAQVPDLTFEEAFQLTGRKINISVSPSEVHQSSRLLNAVTSPNVCIREAVMASCAVPGVFPAVTLMAKNRARRTAALRRVAQVGGRFDRRRSAGETPRAALRRQSLHHQPDQSDRAVGAARLRRRRQSRVAAGRRLSDRDEGMAEGDLSVCDGAGEARLSAERLRADGVQRRDAGLHRRHQHHSRSGGCGIRSKLLSVLSARKRGG